MMKPYEQKRKDRWIHYSLIGSCRWIETKMQAVIYASTASPKSKKLAAEIDILVYKLKTQLNKDIR